MATGGRPSGTVPSQGCRRQCAGLAYVPADRKREGLHLIHSIDFNLLLPLFARDSGRRRRFAEEAALTRRLADRLSIKGDRQRPVQALSGGNQQKVALAKWMPLEPPVLLLNDPTRGVDVETKREIYVAAPEFAAEGKAVVLLSSDTPELVHLCDRVVVFREGRVAATLAHGEASEEAIVAAAMGVRSRAHGGSGLMGAGARLYWRIQWRRNRGARSAVSGACAVRHPLCRPVPRHFLLRHVVEIRPELVSAGAGRDGAGDPHADRRHRALPSARWSAWAP